MIEQQVQIYPEKAPGIAQSIIEKMADDEKPAKRKWFSWPEPKPQNAKPPKEKAPKQQQPPAKQSKPSSVNRERVNRSVNGQHVEFESLAHIEYGLQWFENLIHILAPRLLIVGFVLSMVDLLTRGGLLNNGVMVYAWAIIQAMAIDATLPNMWRLAWLRFDEGRGWAGATLLVVAIALAGVVLAALSIQFLQQSTGANLDTTMARLGINPDMLSYVRSIAVVALAAILSVLNRTKVTTAKPAKVNTQVPTPAPIPVNSQPQVQPVTQPAPVNSATKQHTVNKVATLNTDPQDKRARILHLLNNNVGVTEVAKQVGVSKGYVSQVKAKPAANQ